MNPRCESGIGLQIHHIVPLSQGGKDKAPNFIVLCVSCHYNKRNHYDVDKNEVELATYKYYFESLIDNPTMIDPSEISYLQPDSEIFKETLKETKNINFCKCGCGIFVKNKFAPGHNSRDQWRRRPMISERNGNRIIRYGFKISALR